MADSYTGQASLPYDQGAFDLLAYYALRPELYFDGVADVRPSEQSYPGTTVTFQIQNDLAVVSTALSESSDVSAVAMSGSTVVLTLAEYGNAVITTALGRGTSFLDWDRLVTNVVGYNAGISLDTLAQIALAAGTNINFAFGDGSNTPAGKSTITPKNYLVAQDIRKARSQLRRNNVPTYDGYYFAFIHPDVAYDLMGQTGNATWNEPRAYSAPDDIFTGELGSFQGFRFVETPRAPEFLNAGSSPTTTNVFDTLCLGRQALAKAYSYVDGNDEYPTVVPGPVTDHLRRFVPWGWYWLGAYSIFRQSSLVIIQGASTIN